MLNVIRGKLLGSVQDLREVYAAPPPAAEGAAKPFAVLSGSADGAGSPWHGLRQIAGIELYVAGTAAGELDRLTPLIGNALDKQMMQTTSGEAYACFYLGLTGQGDIPDEERGAIKRGLQFAVLSPQPLTEPVPITSDPWLTAVGSWSKEMLGPEWSTYSGVWPQTGTVPAVMWQITGMDAKAVGPSVYEVQKRLTAFFRAGDSDREHAAMLKLLEELGAAGKLPLDQARRQFLRISEPKISVQAAVPVSSLSAATGPLTVTLTRRTARPAEDAPLMQFIHYQSKMR